MDICQFCYSSVFYLFGWRPRSTSFKAGKCHLHENHSEKSLIYWLFSEYFTRYSQWLHGLKSLLTRFRGSWRGKMGIGIGRFCPGKMGFKPHWDWEKKVKNQKWEWNLRIAKWDLEKKWAGKWDWYPPPHPFMTLALGIIALCGGSYSI